MSGVKLEDQAQMVAIVWDDGSRSAWSVFRSDAEARAFRREVSKARPGTKFIVQANTGWVRASTLILAARQDQKRRAKK